MQTQAAARLLTAILQFRDRLLDGSAPPETTRGTPNCASQFKYLFNACRIPQPSLDEVHIYDPAQYNAVCVVRRNKFYTLPVNHPDGQRLSTQELATGLRSIVAIAGDATDPSVSALTAVDRDFWAEARAQLIADGNLPALETIQSSILLLCLDADCPDTEEEVSRLLLHGPPGAAGNRFYDKSVQLIVFGNGKAGLNFEHAVFDGGPMLWMMDTVLKGLRENTVDHGPAGARDGTPAPRRVPLAVGPPARRFIAEAVRRHDARARAHDLRVLHHRAFGTAELKRLRCSPDAFVQLALQLAAFRVFGHCKATYEAASTRQFRHGRTETTRTVSAACRAWIAAMQGPGGAAGKLAKLREALDRHVMYSKRASRGAGVDRHLLGLKNLLAPGESASLFDDPMYARSKHWGLSTSQVSSPYFYIGFGEVVPDGLGFGYGLQDDYMTFVVTSRSAADGWAPRILRELQTALGEMRALCEPVQGAPKSRL